MHFIAIMYFQLAVKKLKMVQIIAMGMMLKSISIVLALKEDSKHCQYRQFLANREPFDSINKI